MQREQEIPTVQPVSGTHRGPESPETKAERASFDEVSNRPTLLTADFQESLVSIPKNVKFFIEGGIRANLIGFAKRLYRHNPSVAKSVVNPELIEQVAQMIILSHKMAIYQAQKHYLLKMFESQEESRGSDLYGKWKKKYRKDIGEIRKRGQENLSIYSRESLVPLNPAWQEAIDQITADRFPFPYERSMVRSVDPKLLKKRQPLRAKQTLLDPIDQAYVALKTAHAMLETQVIDAINMADGYEVQNSLVLVGCDESHQTPVTWVVQHERLALLRLMYALDSNVARLLVEPDTEGQRPLDIALASKYEPLKMYVIHLLKRNWGYISVALRPPEVPGGLVDFRHATLSQVKAFKALFETTSSPLSMTIDHLLEDLDEEVKASENYQGLPILGGLFRRIRHWSAAEAKAYRVAHDRLRHVFDQAVTEQQDVSDFMQLLRMIPFAPPAFKTRLQIAAGRLASDYTTRKPVILAAANNLLAMIKPYAAYLDARLNKTVAVASQDLFASEGYRSSSAGAPTSGDFRAARPPRPPQGGASAAGLGADKTAGARARVASNSSAFGDLSRLSSDDEFAPLKKPPTITPPPGIGAATQATEQQQGSQHARK